jgi:LysM repeat protein
LWRRLANAFALLAIVVGPLGASRTPQLLRLQGRFTDNPQAPLTDTLPIRFSIWDAADGYGNLLWQDVQNVSIQSNKFQVILGRLTPLPPSVFSGGDRWLEMQIGNDAPLRPRHNIPNQFIQAQVAAPTPAPAPPVTPPPSVPMTPEEKREIELQIEKYNEDVLKEEPASKPPVKPVHHHHPKPPVQVVASEEDGVLGNVYTVQAGDTLKSVAQKLYGKADLWYDLYYLNRDRLGPMGHLFPGQILVLPTPSAGDKAK